MNTAMVMVVAQPAEMAVFDRDARVERACELIADAGQAGAGWIIFPEAYLPGAPAWLWHGLSGDAGTNELCAAALAHAIIIPSDISDRLCRLAQRNRVGVAMGVVECDNGTCYNSLLLIDAHGRICGHYRAVLGPTGQQSGWSPVTDTATMQIGQAYAQQDWAGGI